MEHLSARIWGCPTNGNSNVLQFQAEPRELYRKRLPESHWIRRCSLPLPYHGLSTYPLCLVYSPYPKNRPQFHQTPSYQKKMNVTEIYMTLLRPYLSYCHNVILTHI